MKNSENHSNEILIVFLSRDDPKRWWCKQYRNIQIPERWDFLPSGDTYITRQVKRMGSHWVAKKHAKGYTITLGIMAPIENIKVAKELAEKTKTEREAKRTTSRKQREKKEAEYKEHFAEAVYKYLDFTPEHKKLALDIASNVSESATQVSSGRVGRTKMLSFENKVILATRAYIRHRYTKYEDKLSDSGSLSKLPYNLYREVKAEAKEEIDNFFKRYRKRR
ncbi:MAG: DUF2293 domain-containing protein [Thermoplasmata archaeon]|nr:DUF2293 domain-containing protein [Thermoplasmata archaeon]